MKIGPLDTEQQVIVIAEIGNNHEGDLSRAKELLKRAAEAGADIVKFQTIVPERLVSLTQTERIRQLQRLCLPPDAFASLAELAEQEGVQFMSTPFDLDSVTLLEPLVNAFKIASGDNTFWPLIASVAATGKPIVISTGLLDLNEAAELRDFVMARWLEAGTVQELALLHCVVNYPTRPEDAQLRAIMDLKQLGVTVGYSDHTLGITAAIGAVALGARVIEKHFTLDHQFSDFRDHQLSADPGELKELVGRIRELEQMLGEPVKRLVPSEEPMLQPVRRSIVAAVALPAGHVLRPEDISWVRPGGGLAPGQEAGLMGRRLQSALAAGEHILPQQLED